jgi:Leucine-rich repeat (LRR) protein
MLLHVHLLAASQISPQSGLAKSTTRPSFRFGSRSLAVLLLVLYWTSSVFAAIPESQRQALIDLYGSTQGSGWKIKTNWMEPAGTECTWFGVTCDASQSGVVAINLSFNQLTGFVPASIGNLKQLQRLELNVNEIAALPDSIGDLESFSKLELGFA